MNDSKLIVGNNTSEKTLEKHLLSAERKQTKPVDLECCAQQKYISKLKAIYHNIKLYSLNICNFHLSIIPRQSWKLNLPTQKKGKIKTVSDLQKLKKKCIASTPALQEC